MLNNVVPLMRRSKGTVKQERRRRKSRANGLFTIWEWHVPEAVYHLLWDFREETELIYKTNPNPGRLAWFGMIFEEQPLRRFSEWEIAHYVADYERSLRAVNSSFADYEAELERGYQNDI